MTKSNLRWAALGLTSIVFLVTCVALASHTLPGLIVTLLLSACLMTVIYTSTTEGESRAGAQAEIGPEESCLDDMCCTYRGGL